MIKLLILLSLSLQCMSFDYYEPKHRPHKLIRPKSNAEIENVHIIFMNHLDVGYDGIPEAGVILNVLNTYFTEYFPRAIKVHGDLKKFGFVETFKYTTHPWLVDLYLNCPPNLVMSGVKLKCPSKKDIDAFVNAIKTGVIQWHAGAMNMYYEVLNPMLMQMSLNISTRLDEIFQIEKPMRVVSLRDVPGLTVAAIPHFVGNGIFGISHGINSGSAAPKFPVISRWQFLGKEVLYVQNPGGYPNVPGPYPSNPGGIGTDQCRWVPGMTDVLCFAFRTDNNGPPESYNEVLSNYEIVRAQFPNAKLFASSLETFFSILWSYRSSIPVITNEMGDTWVQGAGSDPRKQAEFKTVVRVLNECSRQRLCEFTDARLINASRFLIKPGEHTYGLNTCGDSSHWNNVDFAGIRNSASMKLAESSWGEQRNLTYLAVEALSDHPVRLVVEKELANLRTTPMDYKESKGGVIDYSQVCKTPNPIQIHFASDGSIDSLIWNGNKLVTSPGKIGQLMYRTYNESDTAFFMKYYSYGWNTGFGKSGSTENAHPESRWWPLKATDIHKRSNEICTFDVRVKNVLPQPEIWYGGAAEYWITYEFQSDMTLNVTMQWFNKTSTRLMEAIYMGFSPDGQSTDWTVSKVGYQVSPYTVVQNGSQWQQGLDEGGVTLETPKHSVNIQSHHGLFVCPWTSTYGPTVWPAPMSPIPKKPGITGMAFNIYNNVWNTNFIYWYPYYDEDANFKSSFMVTWKAVDTNLKYHPSRW